MILSHYSLDPSVSLADRLRLAAANGFAAISLSLAYYQSLQHEGLTSDEVTDLLDEHNVVIADLEYIRGFGADGVDGATAAGLEQLAFQLADQFGCRYLQVIPPAGPDPLAAARAFGSVCDRAADHGLVVAVEFLPRSDLPTVTDAWRLVESAGRANGGICVDIWHHNRGPGTLSEIAQVPGEFINGVQLSDGALLAPPGSYADDALGNRVPPGWGEFDSDGFVHAIRSTGTTSPWSVEVCSTTGWAQPDKHVAEIAAATSDLLA